MKEILFRGKRVNDGKWVYGGFSHELPNTCPLNGLESFIIDWNPEGPYKVIPDSVGMYSGLQDKNGIRIFEGDIVKFSVTNPKLFLRSEPDEYWNLAGVSFDKPFEKFAPVYIKDGCFICEYTSEYGHKIFNYIKDVDSICEIVGNIHDNPKLLE